MKKAFIFAFLFSSIALSQNNYVKPAKDLKCILKFSKVEKNDFFNREKIGDTVWLEINSKKFLGYRTNNKEFFEQIMKPIILEKIEELKKLSSREIINQLTIFTYLIYQAYFGKSFYRWGGDIFDLDDPQYEGDGYKFKYGLDCSGFTVAGYEIASYLNLIPGEEIVFSSKGFKSYCKISGFEDTGGILQKSNNYRLDTSELDKLGNEIVRLEKNKKISDSEFSLLQAGDIVGRKGHFGILVESDGKLFYLESGGYVVPKMGYDAVEARFAIDKFAESGYVTIRRALK